MFAEEFAAIKGISIDYAVLEHARDVVVIEAPFSWDDLGGWSAVARQRGSDADGNTVVGKHLGLESTRTIVHAGDDHLVVTMGLTDMLVVHTPDATLVAHRSHEEAVRRVVAELEQRGWTEAEMNRFAERLGKHLEKTNATEETPESAARREQFEEMLKTLDLKKGGARRTGENSPQREVNQIESRRTNVPPTYKKAFEQFTKDLNRQK